MKIGTDGVLLGSWVSVTKKPFSILDIGAGTGIIALQLAQRSNAEMVDAIEIDENAYEQCVDNFENSPWGDRLFCYHASLEEFVDEIEEKYDLIISNPPFYSEDYKTSNDSRDLARFSDALPFDELIESVSHLLSDEGIFAVIIPRKEEEKFIKMASEVNLFPNRICRVRGNETSEEKRSMLEFSFEKISSKIENLTVETLRHNYTEEYIKLVQDFYLKM
ncbi:tRNA1(Val) (adenine(37)-N6)-methyltransferase [Aequorivita antarctica]|uniref:tRNA1(Val) (adenine(37)-N6)-methyltransferase n=1 Tax=Aequorivita antarctica TaxID=153266 RepID=A0A5C6Z1W4_9FLAO|nr:methyltransferase [Aequorivita antarctica]TXD73937.1 methyltransferase [Aequorivita antarctica]SRX73343.1 tRNA1(Val) (adenine(37)-N6)-methyltransferase [Aequorivita antarctica]